jgi:hypothetical protein
MEQAKINVGECSVRTSLSDIRDKEYPDGVSIHLAVYDDNVGAEASIFMSPDKAEVIGRAIISAAEEARRLLTASA